MDATWKARAATVPRQLEPLGEVALACAPGIARRERWRYQSGVSRPGLFDRGLFLNVDRHFCARVERDRLAIGPKMLYVTSADAVNCILGPALPSSRTGFQLSSRLKQGFQSIDRN